MELGSLAKIIILDVVLLQFSYSSVILSGGPYCSTDGYPVSYAAPGTTVSITCAVDNTVGVSNSLIWSIPSFGVMLAHTGWDIHVAGTVLKSTVTYSDQLTGRTNATLSFLAVSILNKATVQCRNNDNPPQSRNCTLYVLAPPSAPSSFMCTNITTDSLTLQWGEPTDNGGEEVSQYNITGTPGDINVVVGGNMVTVENLLPNNKYSLSIRASNSLGFGPEKSVECVTKAYSSVILSGGPYCSTDGNPVAYAVPGDTISITCVVDNPNGGLNILSWAIPSFGVSINNLNGANSGDIDQPEFQSVVNDFDNTEGTTNATLSFLAVTGLDEAVVTCQDTNNPAESSSCTLFLLGDVCPPDKEPVTCLINACDVSFCPFYPNAQCFSSNCGGCNAVFYDKNYRDVTTLCEQCPEDRPALQCPVNICKYLTCPEHPMAECRVDVCGQCDKAGFFMGNEEVTDNCSLCPAEGQVFQLTCPSSCLQTCDHFSKHLVCPDECIPGCYCPAGKVLDEASNKCVQPSECPCRACDPLPDNCTDVVQPSSNESCGCPTCRACPVEGQEYQDCKTCPVTCTEPDISCSQVCVPGCGCPVEEVTDEELNKCVRATDCPEPDPCTLPVDRGDCFGRIVRYYFISDTQRCEEFYWGGCGGNENRFNYLHECERKCSICPPTCTPSLCLTNRKATCSVSGILSDASRLSGCVISNCQACYYSYDPLPLPNLDSSCPTSCIADAGEIDEGCLAKWGRCVRRGFSRTYPKIPISARTLSTYHCWEHSFSD